MTEGKVKEEEEESVIEVSIADLSPMNTEESLLQRV